VAYDFDGADDGISLGNASALNPTTFSISMWINLDSFDGNGNASETWFMGRDDDTLGRSFAFGADTTGTLRLQMNGAFNVDAATAMSTGTWYHVGCTATSGSWLLYLNGAQDGSGATAATPNSTTGLTTIAYREYASFEEYTNGRIAEVGFWGAVLTASEMVSLARGYSPLLIRPDALLSYVPLVRDLIDYKRGAPSAVGVPAVAAHPRVIMPKRASN
jgi:hypothetical protein